MLLSNGLALLRALCEEALSSTSPGVSADDPTRRRATTDQLLSRAPWILDACCGALDALLDSGGEFGNTREKPNGQFVSPYPSPANSDRSPRSPLNILSKTAAAPHSPPSPSTPSWPHQPAHPATECARFALATVASLLAYPVPWHMVRPSHVGCVGRYTRAALAGELRISSLTCLEELVTRARVLAGGTEEAEFLKVVGEAVVGAVEAAVAEKSGAICDNDDDDEGAARSARVAAVMRVFVAQHWYRAEASSTGATSFAADSPVRSPHDASTSTFRFPVETFLDLSLRFTSQQPPVEPLARTIDVWTALTDWLGGSGTSGGGSGSGTPVSTRRITSSPASTSSPRLPLTPLLGSPSSFSAAPPAPSSPRAELVYRPRLSSLLDILMYRVLSSLSSDPSALDDIDDAHPDATDGLTEWDELVSVWAGVVGKVAELYPGDALSRLSGAMTAIANEWERVAGNPVWDKRTRRLARDLRTVATGFGRVAHLFVAEFEGNFAATGQLIERFLVLVGVGVVGGWKKGAEAGKLYAALFSTLQLFTHWITLWQQNLSVMPQTQSAFVAIVTQCVTVAATALVSDAPENVLLSAGQLMSSIICSVRPASVDIVSVPEMQALALRLPELMSRWPVDVTKTVFKAFAGMYALGSTGRRIPDNEWQARQAAFVQFVGRFDGPLRELTPSSMPTLISDPAARTRLGHCFLVLVAITECVASEQTASREVVFAAVSLSLPVLARLLEEHGSADYDLLQQTLDTVLPLCEVFRRQIGADGIRMVMDIYMSLLNGGKLIAMMQQHKAAGQVLAKFFRLLTVVMEDGGKQFVQFVPHVVSFCLRDAWPKIAPGSTGMEVAVPAFYELVNRILYNQWRWFYPGTVAARTTSSTSPEMNTHEAEFVAFLRTLLAGIGSADPEVVVGSLRTLEQLSDTHKLFQKEALRSSGVLEEIWGSLAWMLVIGEKGFLKEDILSVLLKSMMVNKEVFDTRFIPTFITTKIPQFPSEQKAALSQYLSSINEPTQWLDAMNIVVVELGKWL
ncbi:Exportin-6 [Gonapodya sp. JEL0774]|nr:Exportin-6 [Gonapodya sp. JEL0774]